MRTYAGSSALPLYGSPALNATFSRQTLSSFVSLGLSLSIRLSLSTVSCAFASSAFVSLASPSCFARLTQPPKSIRSFAALSRSLMQPSGAARASETQRGSLWQVTVTQCFEQERGRGSRGQAEHLDTHSASALCFVRCLRLFAAVNCWLMSAPNWWVWLVAEGCGQQLRLRLRNTSLAPIGCRHCRRRRVVRWV